MQAASLLETLEPHLTPATPRTPKLALRGGFGVAVTVHAPAAPAAPALPAASSASQRAGAESGDNSVPAEAAT